MAQHQLVALDQANAQLHETGLVWDDASGAVQYTPAPAAPADVANKAYVDGAIGGVSGSWLQTGGGTMTGPLVLAGAPSADLEAATKKYVDDSQAAQAGLYVPAAGGTFSGPVRIDDTLTIGGAGGVVSDAAGYRKWGIGGHPDGDSLAITDGGFAAAGVSHVLRYTFSENSLWIGPNGTGAALLRFGDGGGTDYIEHTASGNRFDFYQNSTLVGRLGRDIDTVRFPAAGNSETGASASAVVTSKGILRRSTSSGRFKREVHPVAAGLTAALNPVTFESVHDADHGHGRYMGFIAEEVHGVIPEAVEEDNYDVRAIVAALTADLQDALRRIAHLEAAAAG